MKAIRFHVFQMGLKDDPETAPLIPRCPDLLLVGDRNVRVEYENTPASRPYMLLSGQQEIQTSFEGKWFG